MEEGKITKNISGIKAAVVELIESGRIEIALQMFEDNTKQVEEAYREYNPKLHSIMQRADKVRKSKTDYKTNKLPRNWQSYINEIELYFLMNNGLSWELINENEEQETLQPAFQLFQEFLKQLHYDTYAREAKRIAGAETECAKLYAYYMDEGEPKLKLQVLSYSKGYKLRPLFNRYGDLKAFGIGYSVKSLDGNINECWDFYTSEKIYRCTKDIVGGTSTDIWDVKQETNPFGKIPIIYIRQPKAWEGVEQRIERDEWLDSKNADCNEYFADPMLKISKQVRNSLADPKSAGKVIQVNNKDDVFEYVTPPDASDMKLNEKSILKESILMGTLTPDLSYENVKGLGAISGEAITKANILGYIKRLSRMEIYDEYFSREANLIKEMMATVFYNEMRNDIRKMKIQHIYQDPSIGISDNSEEIMRWKEIGMSLEARIEANRNIHNKRLELARIKREQSEAISVEKELNSTNETTQNKEE